MYKLSQAAKYSHGQNNRKRWLIIIIKSSYQSGQFNSFLIDNQFSKHICGNASTEPDTEAAPYFLNVPDNRLKVLGKEQQIAQMPALLPVMVCFKLKCFKSTNQATLGRSFKRKMCCKIENGKKKKDGVRVASPNPPSPPKESHTGAQHTTGWTQMRKKLTA